MIKLIFHPKILIPPSSSIYSISTGINTNVFSFNPALNDMHRTLLLKLLFQYPWVSPCIRNAFETNFCYSSDAGGSRRWEAQQLDSTPPPNLMYHYLKNFSFCLSSFLYCILRV